jgi:hypothetical protein
MSMIWFNSRANGKVRMREATKEVPLENLVSGGFFYTDELDQHRRTRLLLLGFGFHRQGLWRLQSPAEFQPGSFYGPGRDFRGDVNFALCGSRLSILPYPSCRPSSNSTFDEIPAFICGFAYGPWAAFCVIAIKTVIKFPLPRP